MIRGVVRVSVVSVLVGFGLVVLGLVLSEGMCGGAGVDTEVRVSLVDRIGWAEIDGPDGAASTRSVETIERGVDRRRALLLDPPARVRFDGLRLRRGETLRGALAVDRSGADDVVEDGDEHGTVRVVVRCGGIFSPKTVLDQTVLDTRPRATGWADHELPLDGCAPWSWIELDVTCEAARDEAPEPGSCDRLRVAWARPELRHQRALRVKPRRLAILVSIDTLRRERMSLYGAARDTTPRLRELAAESVVFDDALAPSPWTLPSHATLLTSTPVTEHGLSDETRILRPDLPRLAEAFDAAGWQTAGFVATPWLAVPGFARGFDHYVTPVPRTDRAPASVGLQRILRWLDDAGRRPGFVFWHLMDVHGPYGAGAPWAGSFRSTDPATADTLDPRLEQLRGLRYHDYLALDRFATFDDLLAAYDEGLLQADAAVGALVDHLRAAGVWDETALIVTSDHGESFLEREVWVGHGLFLDPEEIGVPLLVKLPGGRFGGRRVDSLARLLDVAPTLLDAFDLRPPPAMRGVSLVDPEPGAARVRTAVAVSSNTGAVAVRRGDWMYVSPWAFDVEYVVDGHLRPRTPADRPPLEALRPEARLYDRTRDPGQEHDLRVREPAITRVLEGVVADTRRELAESAPDASESEANGDATLSPEMVEQLRSLGYLGGSGGSGP